MLRYWTWTGSGYGGIIEWSGRECAAHGPLSAAAAALAQEVNSECLAPARLKNVTRKKKNKHVGIELPTDFYFDFWY